MKGVWQVVSAWVMGTVWLVAAEPAKAFDWDPPKVTKSQFSPQLGMLDAEREEYATNLATHAANRVAASKAAPAALTEARQMLALALHLSPRNKRALVVNFQLAKGILPEVTESQYSPAVFARLMLTRGQLLEKQGGEENLRLARMLIQLAAGMDPKNEDAVYASEVHRLDHGAVNWQTLTAPNQPPGDPAGTEP